MPHGVRLPALLDPAGALRAWSRHQVACFEVLLNSRQSRANCFSLIAQQRARRQVQPIVSTANPHFLKTFNIGPFSGRTSAISSRMPADLAIVARCFMTEAPTPRPCSTTMKATSAFPGCTTTYRRPPTITDYLHPQPMQATHVVDKVDVHEERLFSFAKLAFRRKGRR